MKEVTPGEISRKLDAHIDESKKNNEKQNILLESILIQAQKTNGRMLSLEATREDNKKRFEILDSLNNYRWWATGIFAVIMTISGGVYALAISNLKYQLKDELTLGIEELLDERVSGVYLDNK
jgi:hypothetical protein